MATYNGKDKRIKKLFESGQGGGSSVEWEQIVEEGEKIAKVTIDGEITDVFAPKGGRTELVELTLEEFEALPDTKYTDNVPRLITDYSESTEKEIKHKRVTGTSTTGGNINISMKVSDYAIVALVSGLDDFVFPFVYQGDYYAQLRDANMAKIPNKSATIDIYYIRRAEYV